VLASLVWLVIGFAFYLIFIDLTSDS
jgi:hypothetical protein